MAVLKGGCLAKRKRNRFGYRFGRRYFLTKLGLVECHDGNDININLLHLAARIVKRQSVPKHSKRVCVHMKCMDTSTCWYNIKPLCHVLHVSGIGYIWGIVLCIVFQVFYHKVDSSTIFLNIVISCWPLYKIKRSSA